MNLVIAQMVSLVTSYNDYIASGEVPRNYLESTVFNGCETVGFILLRNYVTRSGLHGDLVGNNPIRWFKYLEKDGCLKLAINYNTQREKKNDSEKISSYIIGTIYIEAIYKSYSNFWHCLWYPKQVPTSEYKWNVRYYLPFRFEDTVNATPNFSEAAIKLKAVLSECVQFTMDNDFLGWSQVCSVALRALSSTQPEDIFSAQDLISIRHPLNIRRVVYAVVIPFMSPEESLWNIKYESPESEINLSRLRDDFYQSLINALMAAINSK
ncbi:hypothetical protein DYU05_19105 [Mucilaginibacter terrenus]|uniref:Uncharacterized protein n=1 Tax=Mucilaginibacter terrenus TaxID=2482727 RepID=A0A3E2NKD9_9SPHI|nr:hypothetical protein [Mucilaginibacter terrenus]RFZ81393.1 hypothetical protein DYU05_19105 [Mucilaginibacter terrenus]